MATVNFKKEGQFAVLDMEYVSAEYSGAGIYSQELELDATDFATKVAENGMALVLEGNVAKLPALTDSVLVVATECEVYEDGKGRNSFAVKRGVGNLRLMKMVSGDIASTNACFYDDTEFADLNAIKTAITAGTVVAVPAVDGLWKITKTVGTAVSVGEVLAVVVLSNDEIGVRIRF